MSGDESNNCNDNAHGKATNHKGGLSPFVCACFTLNYLIGTGFLTLPYAFERSGIILSMISMAIIVFIANVASDYILSAMARADVIMSIIKEEDREEEEKEEDDIYDDNDKKLKATESTSLLAGSKDKKGQVYANLSIGHGSSGGEYDDETKNALDDGSLLEVKERKFELTELCQMFLGKVGLQSYGVAVVLDIYGFLWAYTSVFGTAMSHSFPLTYFLSKGNDDDMTEDIDVEYESYGYYVFIFACIVVPMSFLELSEQATIQVFLSGCRIVMILIMVLTPIIAAINSCNDNSHLNSSNRLISDAGDFETEEEYVCVPHFDNQMLPYGSPMFDISNIHIMIPIVVFSVLFHQAVPGLADEMTDKGSLGLIFGYTYILCFVAYSGIGTIVSWYFGYSVYESSNINWNDYHGGTGTYDPHNDEWINVSWWSKCISIFVVCFPAIDVISAFPLYAFVLGNSIMSLFHLDNIHEIEKNRYYTTFYRSIAAIPPIIGAYFVRNLGIITDYSGLTGIAIAFNFPPLLYIYSSYDKVISTCAADDNNDDDKPSTAFAGTNNKKMYKLSSNQKEKLYMLLNRKTKYERFGSSNLSAKVMFTFGIMSIVYCFVLLTFYSNEREQE